MFLFYGPSRLRQFGCQRFGPVVLLLQRLRQCRRRAVDRLAELVRLAVAHRQQLPDVPPRLHQFGFERLRPVVLLLQRLPQFRRRAVDRLLELHRLVVLRQWRLLRHDRRDHRNELGYLLLTSVSRRIGGDFSVKMHADERRRDQGCGNREKRKEAMTARSTCRRRRVGEAARQTVPLLKIIFPRHWIPARRRYLAGFAVFSDPLTGLRQPTSDIIGPARIIPKDDEVPIPRCGLNRLAHVNHAYSDGLSGHFFFISPIAYSDPWRASTLFGQVPKLAKAAPPCW